MKNSSRSSILLALSYLLSGLNPVDGVCSDKFRECIKTLEKTEDKQKPYKIYPFTRENFEDFVYETWNYFNIEYDEEHGHAHYVDNVEVEKIKYDKLDEELKAVYEETYTKLKEAYGDNILCYKCEEEGFNLHDLFLHENTELVRDFCARVQIHKGVCIPAVNTGYSIEYSQPIEEIIPMIVEMSNERVKKLERTYGQLDAEVKYDEHGKYFLMKTLIKLVNLMAKQLTSEASFLGKIASTQTLEMKTISVQLSILNSLVMRFMTKQD